MKNRCLPMLLAGLMLSSLFALPLLHAQDTVSSECRVLMNQMDALLNETQGWGSQSIILYCVAIATGILGFAIWILQKVRSPWSKGATSAFSLIIVVLTVINATTFDADYRMVRRNAVQLHAEIMDARQKLRGFDGASEADRQIYRQTVINLIKKVEDAEELILNTQISIDPFSTTYASSEQPRWISDPPKDGFSNYFVGKSENPSLAVAKDLSYNNAVDNAARQLGLRLAESAIASNDPLRKYIVDSSSIVQTDFSYDGSRRVYKYFTLLKITRALAQPAFIRAVVRN